MTDTSKSKIFSGNDAVSQGPYVVVRRYAGNAGNITAGDFFLAEGQRAALAIAFISPELDFDVTCRTLKAVAGDSRFLAVSTAGELCSARDGAGSLYCADSSHSPGIVLQLFSADIIAEISIHAVPLFSEDIRRKDIVLSKDQRVEKIRNCLQELPVNFPVTARDTLALTFVDGLSASENYLMEAVYASGRFPCLFVGGSAGGKLDFRDTYLFDGNDVLQNHAIVAFCKMAKGAWFSAFKSQNFRMTGQSFVVIEAESACRTIKTVMRANSTDLLSPVDAMCQMLACSVDQLDDYLSGHTFGIKVDGELFVRSVAKINHADGSVEFYCDVNPGDELFFLEATDFVEQTRKDLESFLQGKPAPVGAILNDCILRRLNNARNLGGMDDLWSMPAAGFSTFGELFGININQTLSAVVFFRTREGELFHDRFINEFPIHYARYMNYFSQCRLQQVSILNKLRVQIIQKLINFINESNRLNRDLGILIDRQESGQGNLDEAQLLAEKKSYEKQFDLVDEFMDISRVLSCIDHSLGIRQETLSPEAAGESPDLLYKTFHNSIQLGQRLRENIISLNRARQEAQAASIAKSQFLANMSHELRTPMNGIIGLAEILSGTDLNDDQAESARAVLSSAKSLLLLLNDILDYSKIESGELVLETVSFNLRASLQSVVSVQQPVAAKKNVDLKFIYEDSVPVHVMGDSLRINQMALNLIDNALKFTDKGHVILRVTSGGRGEDGKETIIISVEDTGIGIPEDKYDRIFQKFMQADGSTSRKYGGTGLGLTITKDLAEMMGGQISLSSKPGEGSVFKISVPLMVSADTTIGLSSDEEDRIVMMPDLSVMRILAVDDHPVNMMFLRKLLKKMGFAHVDEAENGRIAVEKVKAADQPYQAILMDCQMPEMDGFDASRLIRIWEEEQGQSPGIIIAVTAHAMEGDREKCLQAGMNDYIVKPINPGKLYETLGRWLFRPESTTESFAPVPPPDRKNIPDDVPVDLDHLALFTDGDPKQEQIYSGIFLSVGEEILGVMRGHIQGEKSTEEWKQVVHKLKGSSAQIGANNLLAICKEAESKDAASLADKQELLTRIEGDFATVKRFFEDRQQVHGHMACRA